MLSNISGIGDFKIVDGDIEYGLALYGLQQFHPAAGAQQPLDELVEDLEDLGVKLTLEEIEAGMEKGKELDMEEEIAKFLAEQA